MYQKQQFKLSIKKRLGKHFSLTQKYGIIQKYLKFDIPSKALVNILEGNSKTGAHGWLILVI